jgi:hypothetical protein
MRARVELTVGLALAGALMATVPAQALTPVASGTAIYDTAPTTAGDQGYSDVLGDDFTVNVPGLKVVGLGAFDSTKTGITTDITVGLYDLTTSTWVTPQVNFNGTLDPLGAAYVWQSITPVSLVSGDQYSIVGLGFNGVDENYNTNTTADPGLTDGNSPITFNSLGGRLTNGVSRYGGSGDPSASTVFGYASTFGAGSLQVSVPEPATWAMLLLGLGAVGAMARIAQRREVATGPLV